MGVDYEFNQEMTARENPESDVEAFFLLNEQPPIAVHSAEDYVMCKSLHSRNVHDL